MENKLFIWLAKWESLSPRGRPMWSSYISYSEKLVMPESIGTFCYDENDAVDSMVNFIYLHDEFDFIALEHPGKLNYIGSCVYDIWNND